MGYWPPTAPGYVPRVLVNDYTAAAIGTGALALIKTYASLTINAVSQIRIRAWVRSGANNGTTQLSFRLTDGVNTTTLSTLSQAIGVNAEQYYEAYLNARDSALLTSVLFQQHLDDNGGVTSVTDLTALTGGIAFSAVTSILLYATVGAGATGCTLDRVIIERIDI